MRIVLVAALVASASVTGCLGWLFGGDDATGPTNATVDDKIPKDIVDLARNVFKNYTLPGSLARPWTTVWYNDSIGPEANLAVENVRDDGGTDFNGVVKTMDVSAFLPPGQATEIAIRVFWNAAEGNSADLDLYIDLPGIVTSTGGGEEELNFNIPIKSMTVNTVGVAGYPAKIGVQAANGRTVQNLDFHVEMAFSYAKDALTPFHAYAIPVPANATGLIFESVKAAGDEHVTVDFVLLDPNDEPVVYMEYDDLAIPTESVFIPTRGAGEYVFYAYAMRGGFLSVKSDVGLTETKIRTLATKEESVVDASAPAPGLASRDWLAPNPGAVTPKTGGTVVDVNFPFFPLSVRGFIDASGQGGATGMAQVTIESAKGVVSEVTRIARADLDQGTIGYTDDEGQNHVFTPANLAKGPYKITIVNNGNGAVGHTVLSYTR